MCPTRPYKDIPVFKDIPVVPDFPVTHDIPAFQAILQVPVSPGNPPHSSILQLECIFYKFYSSIGFHRKLHRVPVEQYKLQTFYKHYILQRKGDVAISVKRWHILQNRIISSIVLSSEKTNYKNDIQ